MIVKETKIDELGNLIESSYTIDWKYVDVKYKKLSNYVESERNLTYNNDSACFDICASISEPLLLFPGRRAIINTGLAFELDSPLWIRLTRIRFFYYIFSVFYNSWFMIIFI